MIFIRQDNNITAIPDAYPFTVLVRRDGGKHVVSIIYTDIEYNEERDCYEQLQAGYNLFTSYDAIQANSFVDYFYGALREDAPNTKIDLDNISAMMDYHNRA